MISRQTLLILLYALALLVVASTVVLGGSLLLGATSDAAAATVMRWIGATCLMLLAVDVILLVAALGINALGRQETDSENESRH